MLTASTLPDALISSLTVSLPSIALIVDPLITSRTIAIGVAAIIWLFLWRPVWRWLWTLPVLGEYLEKKVFPDLNGTWQIEIQSNWPVIKALADAAKSPFIAQLDVTSDRDKNPEFVSSSFVGKIEQDWRKSSLTVLSNKQSPLRKSRTISFDLLPASDSDPKRVAWTFRQENTDLAETDERNFLGSALLEVENKNLIEGHYWNNRAWELGLNSAGRITMKRLADDAIDTV